METQESIDKMIKETRRFSIGEMRESPYAKAKEFVIGNFPNWEKGCHVLPIVVREEKEKEGDVAEVKVMRSIQEYAKNNEQPMFVMANVKCLTKNRESDIIIVHRYAGVKILEVKLRYEPSSSSESVEASRLETFIERKTNQVHQGVRRIVNFYKEEFPGSSVDEIVRGPEGYVCLPCNVLPASLLEWGEKGVLTADDCQSPESFKKWWEKYIFPRDEDPGPEPISKETYLNLLSLLLGAKHFRPSINRRNLSWLVPAISNTLRNPTAAMEKLPRKDVTLEPESYEEKIQIPFAVFVKPHLQKLMDWVKGESEPWIRTIEGVAGSGKTWILTESASNILANEITSCVVGSRMLVLCFNKPLSVYLEREIERATEEKLIMKGKLSHNLSEKFSERIKVATFDAFISGAHSKDRKEMLKERLQQDETSLQMRPGMYRHIFVDEAMDLCLFNSKLKEKGHVSWLHLLEKIWDKTGCFCLTFDQKQLVKIKDQILTETEKAYLKRGEMLTVNIRNPERICEYFLPYVKKSIGEVTIGHSILGYDVEFFKPFLPAGDPETRLQKGVENVMTIIGDCLGQNLREEFVILTKYKKHKDEVIAKLKESLKDRFRYSLCDAEGKSFADSLSGSNEDEPKVALVVDTVLRFKGLEASCIILFDPSVEKHSIRYIGMSRCCSLLYILTTDAGHKELKKKREDYINERRQKKREGDASISGPPSKSKKILHEDTM